MRLLALGLAVLLAGCSGAVPQPTSSSSASHAPDVSPASHLCVDATYRPTNGTCAHEIRPTSYARLALNWTGNMGTEAHVCDAGVGCQPDAPLTPSDSQRIVAAAGWNLTGASITVTWTATTPATTWLGIAIMTMRCAACNMTEQGTRGTSPLVLHLTDLNARVGDGGVVHVYLYPTYSVAPASSSTEASIRRSRFRAPWNSRAHRGILRQRCRQAPEPTRTTEATNR